MGGFAGHMMHLNDNPNLTFGQMKDIFNKASGGELVGTEKTDGQNLFVSYSVKDRQARAVRNKGEAAKGGLDPDALAAKFADRGNLTETFVESFNDFERAVQSLPIETQMKIFGPNANNFYNAEIMNPSSANVINYDTKSLVIHRVGHVQRDKQNGEIESLKDEELVSTLENALEDIQQDAEKDRYRVQVNAIRNLQALVNDKPLTQALTRLNEFMNENALTDSDTIGDYIVKTMRRTIDDLLPQLSEELKNMLLQRVLGQKGGPTITQIKAQIPPDDTEAYSIVNEMVERNKFFFKEVIYPLEDIVHDFAVEMLRGLESRFMLDNKKEVRRLKDEVALAKEVIEGSNNEEAMEILHRQMEKLKDLENVSTATEGFVFDYDGNTYKFTGTFAPVNQILGLFKYGRGNVPPLQKIQEQEDFNGFDDDDIEITDDGDMILDEEKEKIYIYPGRFQPMGPHHAETYKKIAEEYGPENTYVATSDKVEGDKSPFNFNEKLEIMVRHGIPEDKIVQVKNPYNVLEILEQYDPGDVEVTYFVGEKDMRESPRFQKTEGVSKEGYDWRIDVAPHVDREIEGFGEMSGTSLRDALKNADEETFEEIMGWYDPAIYNMILSTLNELEEISAAGAGAVQGYSGNVDDKKKPTLIREEGIIMREELIVEMKLRELIRKRIDNSLTENKKAGIIYINERQKEMVEKYRVENALRKCIRNLILQEKTEPVPHANTGINQLSDLLKKIVPILSVGFKSLTTTEEQRSSYRSHIINAVINTLAIDRAEDEIEPEALTEADDIDITLEDPDDEKFIDIEGSSKPEDEEEKAFETLPGEDLTGRNVAIKDFDRIERIILDAYAVLDDEKDQDLFYDYLLTNLKLYFDKFEAELAGAEEEPTTDEYEQEQASGQEEDEEGADLMQEKFDSKGEFDFPAIMDESETEKVNPWAICTAKVGRKDKAKYEACVLAVKDEHGIPH